MYSLILMASLTAAPDAVEFGGAIRNLLRGDCLGSSSSAAGCLGYSAPRYSCYGGCSGDFVTSGCCGGEREGLFSRLRRFFRGEGCRGGLRADSRLGCFGSGYGCIGVGYGCSGAAAYSCFGGPVFSLPVVAGPAVSYTPMFNGGLSCSGGLPLSAPPPLFDTMPGSLTNPGLVPPPASIPYAPPEAAPSPGSANLGTRPSRDPSALVSQGGSAARATVIVRLPADAKLFVDNRVLTLTGSERRFVTPQLPPEQEFVYRFRVEYERDGEVVSVTKRVAVRAGHTSTVEFVDLVARAASKRNEVVPAGGRGEAVTATPVSRKLDTSADPVPSFVQPVNPAVVEPMERAAITVRLPAGATLYVDDRKTRSSEPVRHFTTPPLPVGREFAYLLKVEVERDGHTETYTQRVPFRGGERVEIDFTGAGR